MDSKVVTQPPLSAISHQRNVLGALKLRKFLRSSSSSIRGSADQNPELPQLLETSTISSADDAVTQATPIPLPVYEPEEGWAKWRESLPRDLPSLRPSPSTLPPATSPPNLRASTPPAPLGRSQALTPGCTVPSFSICNRETAAPSSSGISNNLRSPDKGRGSSGEWTVLYNCLDRTTPCASAPPSRETPTTSPASPRTRADYPPASRPTNGSPRTRYAGGKLFLPGTLHGVKVDAVPDTGSAENVISGEFARANNFPIYRTTAKHTRAFQFANRNLERPAGRCLLDWRFINDPYKTYSTWFDVLEGCPHPVVIGNPLLKETDTMSKNKHRLQPRQISPFPRNSFFANSIGPPQQRLVGKLNGRQVSMLPDTGSERNIISEAYARAQGLQIYKRPQNRAWLVFADGSMRQTIGQVEAHLGLDNNPLHDFPVMFDVLQNCAHEVIIGGEILYEKEVFSRYVDRLQDAWTGCDYDEFSLVGLAIFEGCFSSRCRTAHEDARANWDRKTTIENERRIKVERVLGPDRATPDWRKELQRRTRWRFDSPPPPSLSLASRPAVRMPDPHSNAEAVSISLPRLVVPRPLRARQQPRNTR